MIYVPFEVNPRIKDRIEAFLNYTGLTLSELVNALLLKFIKDNGLEDVSDDHKFEFKKDNNDPESSFVLTKKELLEKFDDAVRRYRINKKLHGSRI